MKYSTISLLLARTLVFMLACGLSGAWLGANDEIPGAPQQVPVALVGGTVYPVDGPAVEGATVLFANGRISAVGKELELPTRTHVVSVAGFRVYPGLFESHSQLGLIEVRAVRASRDQSESGRLNPNARAYVSVNPDSELIPVARSGGVLLALTAPTGGLISGKSAVLQLDGWTSEDLALQKECTLQVTWPVFRSSWHASADAVAERRKKAVEDVQQLRDLFSGARAYARARAAASGQAFDSRLEAMRSVLEGTTPIMVEADGLTEIQSAVAFAHEQDVRLIVLGGYDAPHCAELLKKHDVPVIVSATHRVPRRRDDPYDHAYTLPERLRQAGVRFAISGSYRSWGPNTRNLPHHAAMAAAFGLPREEALKAVTLYPAQILGVADRVGSLLVGKDATLIVTDGDPLETTTRVHRAYIGGREVDLRDRHKRLYRKYREKYRRLGAFSE